MKPVYWKPKFDISDMKHVAVGDRMLWMKELQIEKEFRQKAREHNLQIKQEQKEREIYISGLRKELRSMRIEMLMGKYVLWDKLPWIKKRRK